MRILADRNIPYLLGVLEPYAEVEYCAGQDINSTRAKDADALIIRTRTQCNEELLSNSKVQMIATATIGHDHINTAYCANHNIQVATAAGCNARAVAQWVFAARQTLKANGTLGIIGVGNVGQEVLNIARERAVKVLLCDPPRAQTETTKGDEKEDEGFVSLDYLLTKSDLVTMHVPLNKSTRNMADTHFFQTMKQNAVFFNSSRGEVVNEQALHEAIKQRKLKAVALDVWQNEPHINIPLLNIVQIATPHIAGYSAKGKARGTQMVVQAIAQQFGINKLLHWKPEIQTLRENPDNYDIMADDLSLRTDPDQFETLRNNYKYR